MCIKYVLISELEIEFSHEIPIFDVSFLATIKYEHVAVETSTQNRTENTDIHIMNSTSNITKFTTIYT